MAKRWMLIALALSVLGGPAFGETVYLKTGEVIKGKIVRAEQDTIAVESDKGFGVIQLKRADIVEIEYEQNERDFSRLFGVGYFHRFAPLAYEANGFIVGIDALAMKMWFSDKTAVEALFGYQTVEIGETSTTETLTLEIRYTQVFSRRGLLDMYWGAGGGFVNQSSGSTDSSGTIMEGFLGAEVYFRTLPNFAISTEIGLILQQFGDGASSVNTTVIAPSVVARYYF